MIGQYKVFRYLDKKSIYTIDLVCDHPLYDPLDPYKLYNYLNNLRVGYENECNSKKSAQTTNTREFKQKYNNIEYFKYLDVKRIEAFWIYKGRK